MEENNKINYSQQINSNSIENNSLPTNNFINLTSKPIDLDINERTSNFSYGINKESSEMFPINSTSSNTNSINLNELSSPSTSDGTKLNLEFIDTNSGIPSSYFKENEINKQSNPTNNIGLNSSKKEYYEYNNNHNSALSFKEKGNKAFSEKNYVEALYLYTSALSKCSSDDHELQAIILCNRAACYLISEEWNSVISDCNKAIFHNPNYIKAYKRRLAAFEALKNWDKALEEINTLITLDPSSKDSFEKRQNKLKELVLQSQAKEKEEVIEKLKDLGNTFLGKFGMSLNNFKTTQNESGSYNIQYVPNDNVKK